MICSFSDDQLINTTNIFTSELLTSETVLIIKIIFIFMFLCFYGF